MDSLPILYQRMSDLTGTMCANGYKECSQFAERAYRCCDRKYCEIARVFARTRYGVELESTGNPELLFMGPHGCTVAPHLRPICTLHICCYSWSPVSFSPAGYDELITAIIDEESRQGKRP